MNMLKSHKDRDESTDTNVAATNEKIPTKRVVINVVAIAVCVLLLPILIINCTLLLKSVFSPDEVPTIFGRAPLVVLTESMEPTIKSGDLIVCDKVDGKDVKEGDVISFFDPDSKGTAVVTHRVVKVEVDEKTDAIFFRTKGDNNDLEDRTSVPTENLVGIWKENGTLNLFRGLGSVVLFMQSTWGFVVCIVLPLAAIAVVWFINNKKKKQEQEDDMNALLAELNALKSAQTENAEAKTNISETSPNYGADGTDKN